MFKWLYEQTKCNLKINSYFYNFHLDLDIIIVWDRDGVRKTELSLVYNKFSSRS